ncbi:MAG: hypothetical protein ACK5Q5_10885 [Planctomycetaceae bacterium]
MSYLRSTGLALLGLLVMSVVGCGLSAYEERLAKTDQRNRYLARLDATLAGYWNQPSWGIWLRPPKGLLDVAAPARPTDGEEEPVDLRQQFMGVPLDLPGIIQVWEGTTPTAGSDPGPFRLYLLGNHGRFARTGGGGESADPKTYLYDLELALQNLYGVTLPQGDGGRGDQNNVRYRQTIPSAEEFTVSKPFVVVNFVPEMEGQQPFNASLYEHTAGPVQLAVLLLASSNASHELRQSLQTALETLQVSSDTPGLQSGATSGGGTATF